MWSELTHVQDPSLRLLATKLPQVVLGSRADSTTATYLCSFKRWCSWASGFPEISVLPATPAFVPLYLLSVLQASTSPAPVQTALYSIRWAHDLAGIQSPTSHTLPQKNLPDGDCRIRNPRSRRWLHKFSLSSSRSWMALWSILSFWPWQPSLTQGSWGLMSFQT